MVSRLARLFVGVLLLAGTTAALVAAAPQSASAVNFFGDACQGSGADSAACSGSGNDNISGTDGIILRAAALLSIIAGITAVVMIIVAAMMFITAAGDSNKIGNAKKIITYTVVGLVVIFLARAIVVFVVNNV